MPVSIQLLQFEGFAVLPEDIQFGEANSTEILVNRNGAISNFSVARDTLTVTLKGINANQAQGFVDLARNNRQSLVRSGNAPLRTITIAGKTLINACLIKATPSGTIKVAGLELMESLQLEYQSLFYT